MATTTILGTELELKQRKHNAEQANGEFSEITPPASDNERSDEMGKGMPLRANIAAPTEALVGSESDPYGYKNRKKTSWGTVPWFWLIPDPLFRVWIHNIHNNKHGSSTLAFDNEGKYRPQFLDEFFERNDKDGKGGLTFEEGYYGLRRIRFAWDIFGQISAFFEWGMTYVLLWPEDGIVRKDDARRVLDGSIFHELTMQHRKYNGNAKAQ
ncbi:hypothetical protein LTR64_003834 [Lithohypha guttulata]|uniref:uncharacterized protein n=1 Tax=Lithohypha guttulata TaxID=1690604 RepID=UPI002DDDD9B8|nr:hypothetical protein LTR51_006872 [Lithohypha guttulata]